MKNPHRLKQNRKPGICSTLYCSNKVKGNRLQCSTCRKNKHRLADPVKYAYDNMKNRAKQRWKGQGKPFTITLEYFRHWCHEVNYVGFAKGRSKKGYTVDCIINHLGYVPGNLQLLTRSANSKKYFAYDWREKQISWSEKEQFTPGEDLPF